MSDPFVAEIRIWPTNFAPQGWAFCNGQLLPLSQNTALFSLLGTIYGGNGLSTFALPDFQDRAPMHVGAGQGPGLSARLQGETGGTETVTLLQSEMPSHTHALQGIGVPGNRTNPAGNTLARPNGATPYAPAAAPTATLAPDSVAPAGSGLPHNNMQPYLALNFCIALQGIFPPR